MRFITWSLRAYRNVLFLYPDELRLDFSADMLEMFGDDLAREYETSGVRGALHVWRATLRELMRIALPSLLQTPLIAVPTLSSAAVLVLQSPLLMQLGHAGFGATVVALAIEAAVAGVTTFTAVYRWNLGRPIALGIS